MSETPGLPSALGIEAVEWLAQGESVTVRVQGRWRRRRAIGAGQPLLVVEVLGQRHRFPAMPEPPSVTGAAPGTWQMSFSVPAALAPPHAQRAWLQMGAVAVPLPLPVGTEAEDLLGIDEETPIERRLRNTELALENARRRAGEAELIAQELARGVAELEDALEAARVEPERLSAAMAELDRARLVAERRAHAERARRHELEDQLAELRREAAADHTEELAAAAERVRELEDDVRQLVRRLDHAEHAAEAAIASRAHAARLAAGEPRAEGVRAEQAALRDAQPAPAATPAAAPPLAHDAVLLARERASGGTRRPVGSDAGMLAALRAELEARARSEAALRAEIAELRGRLGADPAPVAEIEAILGELRAELDRLAQAVGREADARAAAERRVGELERELEGQRQRSARASGAIDRLRGELAGLLADRTGLTPGPAPSTTTVDPERFSAALSRLREAAPAEPEPPAGPEPGVRAEPEPPAGPEPAASPEPEPEPVRSPDWLASAFRNLADHDAAAAGSLLLALLPAQRLVHPQPIAYDLVLDTGTCVQVTVTEGGGEKVETRPKPRKREVTAFRVIGDPGRIARLLASGSLRRRIVSRRYARVKGSREQAAALTGLIRPSTGLAGLLDMGVTLDPLLTFELAAAMIDPAWNVGETFVIAHRFPGSDAPDAYLWIRDRARALVSQRPPAPAASLTIESAGDELAPVLAGRDAPSLVLDGEQRLLELVRAWLERAQRA